VSVAEIKIKSFEELEEALGELMLEKGTGSFHEEINYYNVLGLIKSFKTWVRKRLNEITRPEMLSSSGSSCAYADDELLKILEGEGGEKEKG